jgi:hydrogenase expression/formation protein HypE
MRLAESAIPFKPDVLAACERACADRLLAVMRAHPPGRDAAIIGEVVPDPHAFVQMQTRFGGSRIVDWLAGDPLPRIC